MMAHTREALFARLADIATVLSAGQADALALEFETSPSPRTIRSFGGLRAPDILKSLCRTWQSTDVAGQSLADALRCAAQAVKTVGGYERIALLYTGPSTDSIRRHQQALLEVIRGARSRLWLVSYVVSGAVDEVLAALQERADASVEVRVLVDHLVDSGQRAIKRFRRDAPRCEMLLWPKAKRRINPGRTASLHAKCAVADGRQAFVSSANLTGQAMDHNLEVGYLVTGGDTPAALDKYLSGLLQEGTLVLARFGDTGQIV